MEEPAWLRDRIAAGDPNVVITEMALAAKSEICEKTIDMFVSAYGAEAGNLALKVLSIGGLYVGGGIAPRLLEKLKDGTFMRAFTDKGRLSQLLINMPVRVILESRAALLVQRPTAKPVLRSLVASRRAPHLLLLRNCRLPGNQRTCDCFEGARRPPRHKSKVILFFLRCR